MLFDINVISNIIESKDPQDVANEFANALNEAIRLKKEKEEKAAKEKFEQNKKKDAQALEALVMDYIHKYYPEIEKDIVTLKNGGLDTFVMAIDTACQELKKMRQIVFKSNDKDVEKALDKFLKDHGL